MTKLPSLARARWLNEPSLQRAFAVVAEAGGEARVAGGAVRNALLGIPVSDIDLATTLGPQKITEIFRAAGHGVHPLGIEHGTVMVVIDKRTYEITTLRRDVETDGRRAVVTFTDNWADDARRRDFTMNALYCDARGKIHDYANGYEDILRKRIIFVGSPAARIKEDYLRILRYFRFLSVFENMKADGPSLAACVRLKKGLLSLSAERISQEMFKLLVGPKAVAILRLMARHGVLKNVIAHTQEFRVLVRLPGDPLLRAFVLAEKPHMLRDAWRLSNVQARRIDLLASNPRLSPKLRENEQRRILYAIGEQAWRDAVALNWARSRASLADRAWKRMLAMPKRWPAPKFPVAGRDLLAAGLSSGPEVGGELKRLEDFWIASDFKPTKDELLGKVSDG
jgi:poly(A) polymerase